MRILNIREIQSLFLSAALFAQMFLVPTAVHADPLSVEPGTPNIWSLEQAHYLLARIRERNLGLRIEASRRKISIRMQ
jgi:hypothetical protein